MEQYPKRLYVVNSPKVVGFKWAVKRLGTHWVCGHEVEYTPAHVRHVLQGRGRSRKMLQLIAERAPELFEVCVKCPAVEAWWKGWKAEQGAHEARCAAKRFDSRVVDAAKVNGKKEVAR